MPQAQLFDGTTLDFPDGTPDEVIGRVAKRETDRIRTEQARQPLPDDVQPSTAGAGRGTSGGRPAPEPTLTERASAVARGAGQQALKTATGLIELLPGQEGAMQPAAPAPKPAAAAPEPIAPFRDQREALDEAVNFIDEGVPAEKVYEQFGKIGVGQADIEQHGLARGSEFFKGTTGRAAGTVRAGASDGDIRPTPTPDRSMFAVVNDTMINTANAAAAITKTIPDLMGPDGTTSRRIDKFVKDGQRAQSEWQKMQREKLSEQLSSADGEVDKAGAYLYHAIVEDPLSTLSEAAGNVGPFALVGKAMAGLKAGQITAGSMAVAGAAGAGEVRGNIWEAIHTKRDADLMKISPEYKALRAGGMDEDAAKREIGANLVRNLPELIAVGAVGALGGKFGLEALATGAKISTGRISAGLIGLADEGSQGAIEQLATNLAIKRAVPGQKLTEDVLMNAVAEGLVGGVSGVVAGGNHHHLAAEMKYQRARELGLNVNPPMVTDPPDVQHSKTVGVFKAVAAKYGIDPAAVKRAMEAVEGLPADDVGPFLKRLTDVLTKKTAETGIPLVRKPIDPHAADLLAAGPMEETPEAEPETKSAESGTKQPASETGSVPGMTFPNEEATNRMLARIEAMGKRDRDGLREWDRAPAAKEAQIVPKNVPEAPMLEQPAEPQEPLDTDIKTKAGNPFATERSAQRAMNANPGSTIVAVEGGFVVRPQQQEAQDAQPSPSPAAVADRADAGRGADETGGGGNLETLPPDEARPGAPVAETPAPSSTSPVPMGSDAERAGAVAPTPRPQPTTMGATIPVQPKGTRETSAADVVKAPAPAEGADVTTSKGLKINIARAFRGKYTATVDGKEIGAVLFTEQPTGGYRVTGVGVTSEMRRKGVASALYDYLENEVLKQPLQRPSGGQSESGAAFRKARDGAGPVTPAAAPAATTQENQDGNETDGTQARVPQDGEGRNAEVRAQGDEGQGRAEVAPEEGQGVLNPAPAPATAAQPQPEQPPAPEAAAPADERVKVKTRFGSNVYVNKADLDSDKPRMRHFTSTGKSLGLIVRENLDQTGELRAADVKEQADNPLFDTIGTKDGRVFATRSAAAREQKMRGIGDTHDVAPEGNGFILKRKPAAAKHAPAPQTAEPAPESTPPAAEAEQPAPVAANKPQLDDFGQKLEGAKKDQAPSLREALSDDDIEAQPFSKVWPAAELDAIEDTFAAAVATAARAEVPAKPRVQYKLDRWVEKVKTVRTLAQRILNGDVTRERMLQEFKDRYALRDFGAKVRLMEKLPREQWNRIGEVSEAPEAYRYEGDGITNRNKVVTPMVRVSIDGKTHWLEGSGVATDHVEAVLDMLGAEAAAKPMQFEVRGREGSYSINKKGDPERRKLKTFTTSKEAFAFIKDNRADLVAEWEGVKYRDNVRETDVRGAENRPRAAEDYRKGADVTPEQFNEAFGFRGVQFGNWVAQGNDKKARQGMLNGAYDALMDLANIVQVPPKALSLNGTLGLAFGARGSGSASAHYEPGNLVINLTKTRGAGTLAHEWFHALDNYFSHKRGKTTMAHARTAKAYRDANYITHRPEPLMVRKDGRGTPVTKTRLEEMRRANPSGGSYLAAENWHVDPKHPAGVRPEVEERFAALVKALDESPMRGRATMIDKGKSDGYWSQTIERAARSFENYVIAKMMEKGYHNDYLANVKPAETFSRDKARYPYLMPEEVAPVAEAFDALFGTIETRETDTGTEMLDALDRDSGFPDTEIMPRPEVDEVPAADPEDQRILDQAAKNFRTKQSAAFGTLQLTALPAPTLPSKNATVGEQLRYAAFVMAQKVFGKRIIFYRTNIQFANGFQASWAPGHIFIAESTKRPVMAVLGHELLHALRNDNPALYNKLRDRLGALLDNPGAYHEALAKKYRDAKINPLNFDKTREELFGDIVGDFFDERAFWQQVASGQPTLFGKILKAVRDFLNGVLAKLQSARPYGTERYLSDVRAARDIVAEIMGDYAAAAQAGQRTGPVYAEAEVMSAAEDQTETPEFRRWFGDSKVVDADGKPLVVYHGTPNGEVQFEKRDRGIFFTSSQKLAGDYTRQRGVWMSPGKAPAMYPAYLSMRTPLVIDALGKRNDNIPVPWKPWKPKVFGNLPANAVNVERALAYAREKGHDGLIVRNVNDGAAANETRLGDVYAVLRPEQIKSATGNRGTFDPADPDIRMSFGDEDARSPSFAREEIEAKKDAADEALAAIRKRHKAEKNDLVAAQATEAAAQNRTASQQEMMAARHADARNGMAVRHGQERGVAERELAKWEDAESDLDETTASRAMKAGLSAVADVANKGPVIVGQTTRQYTAEQLDAMRNVGMQVQPATIQARTAALWKDAGKKLSQGLFDQFRPVRDISKEAYGLLRLSKGASGAFEVMLNGGKLKLTDGVYDFDQDNKGGVVDRLLKPLQGEHHDFLRWVAANRAERLMGQGKENLFTAADIVALKTLADGTTNFDYTVQAGAGAVQVTRDRTLIYADALRVFNGFHSNVLDMAEQSGMIDGDARKLWENEFYVPFYRVEDDGSIAGASIKNGAVRQQAFRSLTGRTEKLNSDLLDNTLRNWAHLLDAAAKNRAAKATIEAAERLGGAEKVEGPSGEGTVWFRENGDKRYSMVSDPHLVTAISALQYAGMNNPIMRALSMFKMALTRGVTISPYFKIRNLIRDSVQAIATAPLSYNVAANVAQGWKLASPKSDSYFRLLAGGGTIHFGTMMEGSEAKRVQSLVESGVDANTILNDPVKLKAFCRKILKPAINAYDALGDRGEAVNRASLYAQLTKQGMNHAEASLMARDLMDFSMQGSFTSIRFLSQTVPFLNARLQGLYKLGRAAKENPARFATVLGATALFSIALAARYGDDDDWKKREEWDRNNYWWFKIGGNAYRIPKPFEVGAFATVAERGFELAASDEMTGKRFREQMLALLSDNLSMNPVPQMVKPMLDVYANKSSFTGRPIEPMGMDRLQSEYRFTNRTTMAARAASTAANAVAKPLGGEALSPVQIDFLVQGYFGWLGAMVVGFGDVLARPLTNQPTRPAQDMLKAVTGGMVSELRDAPSRYVTQMYTQAKEVEQAYATYKALLKQGKGEDASAFAAENRGKLGKHEIVAKVKKAESELNAAIRGIEVGPGTSAEKRERIRAIQIQKDRIARALRPAPTQNGVGGR